MPLPRQSDRAFGFTFACLFVTIFAVGWLVFAARPLWALWIAGTFALLALAAPWLLLPLNRLWGWIAGRLSIVNNFLLLGMFLFLVITPIGMIMRILGYDPMQRRLARSGTYWTPVGRDADGETVKDMF